jgi:hypothetical protein
MVCYIVMFGSGCNHYLVDSVFAVPCQTLQFQDIAECTVTCTVMLNLILLASLNEFNFIQKKTNPLKTDSRSPWQQTQPKSCLSANADTSFHCACNKLCITLQNALMHSHTIYVLLQLCAAFLHIWCASSTLHSSHTFSKSPTIFWWWFLQLNDLLHTQHVNRLSSVSTTCFAQYNRIWFLRCFFILNDLLHTQVKGRFQYEQPAVT